MNFDDRSITSARDVIERKTRDEIDAYLSGRGKTRIHEGARNLSRNVSDDYGNRFLVELIQNAHDAHSAGTINGEISIVFVAEEGKYGCLYVANRGNGFSEDNFRAITNIALSSKPVNESIGNKGLGFRSVLQICQWPEIYSVEGNEGRREFDGYCFRFADQLAVESVLFDQPASELAAEIVENMPCWYLPVYATERPGLVPRFAEEGFASVVRMPIDSAKAREAVTGQMAVLLGRERPLHLFLDRISRIRIEHGAGKIALLERRVVESWRDDKSGVVWDRLVTGEDQYLVATRPVNEDLFQKHLDDSLAKKEVPEAWRNWKGSAQVSIAVRLGLSVEKGVLYCFLPLGDEAKAPFSGYINANFYTKMDRRSVNEGIGLNRLFVETAADLSCRTIEFLVDQNWHDSPGAVVDLLCWGSGYSNLIQRGLGSVKGGMADRPLLPTLGPSDETQWSSARRTVIWNTSRDACLSPEAVTRIAGARLLLPRLTQRQRDELERFLSPLGIQFMPSAEVIAAWVEKVAQQMLVSAVDPGRWATFYDEIALHLRSTSSILFGRQFLLGIDGDLIAAERTEAQSKRRRAADIYFPPVMSVDTDVDDSESRRLLPLEEFPASLKQGFALLSRDIPWLNPGGGYRPARAFFLEAKLVREYDTREVIRTLAVITRSDEPDSTKELALEWAFRLWSSGRSLSEKETRAAGFYVPTRGGWRPTEAAMFGNGWELRNGKQLEALLKSAGDYSQTITVVKESLVPPYASWPVKHGIREEWVQFLQDAGVRDSLRPVGGEIRIQKEGNPSSLADQLATSIPGISGPAATLWRLSLVASAQKSKYSTVPYRGELHAWLFPGQLDSSGFPSDLRKDYAIQVFRAISGLTKEHLQFRVFRPGRAVTESALAFWSTPLALFLRETQWMPIAKFGDSVRFVKPSEAWHFDSDDERVPRFMEIIVPSVAKCIDGESLDYLRGLIGLRVLNDERDAIHAVGAYARTAIDGLTDSRDVKRFCELFGEVWSLVAPTTDELALDGIPVIVDGNIDVIRTDVDENKDMSLTTCYFVDEDDSAKRKLIEELKLPVFDFGKADYDDTWGRLEAFAPGRFARLSTERLDVLVDGIEFDATVPVSLLSDLFGPWIVDFIVCVAEHKGGKFFKSTQSTLGKIRREALSLGIYTGKSIQIRMAGEARDLPPSLHGAVLISRAHGAVLIIQTTDTKPTLQLLAQAAEQFAAALQYPMLSSALDAGLLRLSNEMGDREDESPDEDDIAAALGVSTADVAHTRKYVRADLSSHLRFAILLAASLGREIDKQRLEDLEAEQEPSEEAILAALGPICEELEIDVTALVDRLGAVIEPIDLMRSFGLSLAKLNAAIRGLAGEFKPINNEQSHRRQLDAYLKQHAESHLDLIRRSYFGAFDRGDPLDQYARFKKAVLELPPNSSWFDCYDELSDELLEAHVAAWFAEHEISVITEEADIPSRRECRDDNGARLKSFWVRYGPVLSPWVRQGGDNVTPLLLATWSEPRETRQEYLTRADSDGWLDFRLLDESAIAKRLESYGVWPNGISPSVNLSDWGLTETAIRDVQEKQEIEREIARQRLRKIHLDGQEMSALVDDYAQIVAAVAANAGVVEALRQVAHSFKPLADIEKPKGGAGGGSGGGKGAGGTRPADSGLSDDQKKAIGLIGERYAYEWIKRYHREQHDFQVDDNCWVSGYRNVVLGTVSGNDMLGYDFIVRLKSVTFYYEVKASTGESHTFEMGPTEIAAAHKYKAGKDNRYFVVYVANATDRNRVSISVLPNPFSKEGERKLRAVGRGSITFEFAPGVAAA